jgi:hypothetical protein
MYFRDRSILFYHSLFHPFLRKFDVHQKNRFLFIFLFISIFSLKVLKIYFFPKREKSAVDQN